MLSKVDIFDIRNNERTMDRIIATVVNCSQKLISLIFGTTSIFYFTPLYRCELLSKVDIFDIRNNCWCRLNFSLSVVNCSQKLISLIFGTTCCLHSSNVSGLWIALKSWYLWYSEQLHPPKECDSIRCELLSKVDIFDIRNNLIIICSSESTLWIALKSWYLWYSEQLVWSDLWTRCSCELLSKVDIFDIRNNKSIKITPNYPLWIALKSWYLWYSEQRRLKRICHLIGCELLSKVDIFDIRNNQHYREQLDI